MRIALVALLAGCLQSSSVPCGADMVCPDDQTCVHVTDPDMDLCADPGQLADCANKPEYTRCGMNGRCYDGVCLPIVCGNGRVDRKDPSDPNDVGEICDDSNQTEGDGCSSNCESNETCGNGVVDLVEGDQEQCDDRNLVSNDGCDSKCQRERPRLELVGTAPMERTGEAIAYDVERDRIVMFGGTTLDGFQSAETWEAIASGWVQQTALFDGPSARTQVAMAYDIAHHQVVLFSGGPANDTWTWDGTSWTEIFLLDKPSPRSGHSMVYDVKHQRVVMFGGATFDAVPKLSTETWEWDGNQWLKNTAPPPTGRTKPAMAYDPAHARVVMWGGSTDPAVYEYDGTSWTSSTPAGPAPEPRTGASLAFEPNRGDLVLVGGVSIATGLEVEDAWRLEGGAWQAIAPLDPPAKPGHAITTDVYSGEVIVIGTSDGSDVRANTQSFWLFDGAGWTWEPQLNDSHRDAYSLARDPMRGVIVRSSSEGIAEFDGSRWSDQVLAPIGQAWGSMEIAYDETDRQTLVFGGVLGANGTGTDVTWSWDGDWHELSPTTRPPGRFGHGMAFDRDDGRVLMFGGTQCDACTPLADTWEWDGTSWIAITSPTRPPARMYPAFAYDPIRKTMVMFGGDAGDFSALGDTWLWNGADWIEQHPATSPSARVGSAMAWDANRERIVLYGGDDATGYLDDVWEWDGVTWTQQTTLDTTSRAFHTMTTNLGPGVLVFSGQTVPMRPSPDISVLRYTSATPTEACRYDIDGDGDGLAGCDDPDCWWVCRPLCPPGASCDPAAPYCGDGVCDGLENGRMCPKDCAIHPQCGDGVCDVGEACLADCP